MCHLQDILDTIMGLPNIVRGMNHNVRLFFKRSVCFEILGINFQVEFELFTHLDFLWGIDADKYVYSYMLENLKTCTETDCRNGRK